MDSPDAPHPPDEPHYVFTEGIPYSTTGTESIWGHENPLTLRALQRVLGEGGQWLNLAAGDGRYNNEIARLADKVFATDIDESALRKLLINTPEELKSKVETRAMNLVEKFPFERETIDGVFSAGTLHLFPVPVFNTIASEITRVLKVGGVMVLEFRIDINRVNTQTSETIKFGDEPLYDHAKAILAVRHAFPDFGIQFLDGDKVEERFDKASPPFQFSCTNLLVTGIKK